MYKEILSNNYNIIKTKVEEAARKYNRSPDSIKILAVSKTHKPEVLLQAMSAGINIFAENYAQEFRDKNKKILEMLSTPEYNFNKAPDFDFHFIGHLQSNKVKYLVPFVSTIHTVDSIKLASEINSQAVKNNKIINVLIQINTSNQESKSGIEPEAAETLAENILNFNNIKLLGLMTIGTFSDDETIIRKEFSLLRNTLYNINSKLELNLTELSMGMSHDYEIAISEGATMLRIGTAIFGARKYL